MKFADVTNCIDTKSAIRNNGRVLLSDRRILLHERKNNTSLAANTVSRFLSRFAQIADDIK